MATITATAAGALAAGLVLNVSPGLPVPAKILGLASIILLTLSTVVFVIASLVHPRTFTDGEKSSWRILIRPWESVFYVEGSPNEKELLNQSKTIRLRIFRLMDSALWIAGGAMFSFIAALVFIAFQEPVKYDASVEIAEGYPRLAACPSLPRNFAAIVSKVDLERDIPELPVAISDELCGSKEGTQLSLYLDRSKITVVVASRK
ncbi:hypothetical protein [Arthrobacter sp. LFS091]|uniref:hypothetical protein n=1 Tax=Arthrobacter sp. LFS091 TaxID=3229892 RepID=UPI003A810763